MSTESTSPPEAADLTDERSFQHWSEDLLRFGDLDPLGHVNNAAFATFFETARVAFFRDVGRPAAGPVGAVMIVRLVIEFRAQLHYPGLVRMGTRPLRVGHTSVLLGHGLFKDGACAATSEATLVLVDLESGRPTPIDDELRARILAYAGG